MLDIPVAEASVEGPGRKASVVEPPRHATRSTRNGRAEVNYSQKYHPMDEVTRPKRAQRITGGRHRASFAETSDEDELELSSGEGTDADEPSETSRKGTPTTRMPDPGAVRHSARTEAKKPVNYSKNFHPQDYAIPGFRGSAKRKRGSVSSAKSQKRRRGSDSSPAKLNKAAKKQAAQDSPIVLSSEKTSDSDSDDDEPPANQPSNAASPSPSHADNPVAADSYGADAQSPKNNHVPPLPRHESSINVADAIVQGRFISRKQAATQQSDPDLPTNDVATTNFDNASTKEIGDAMIAILAGVATPNTANLNMAGPDHTSPIEPIFAQPSATMPTALISPRSMETSNKSCSPPKTQLAIKRPYMATQPLPFGNGDHVHKPNQSEPVDEPTLKASAVLVQSTTNSDPGEEPSDSEETSPGEKQPDTFSDASRQAMRDASEDAARTARVMQTTHQLSSRTLSQGHSTSKNGNAGTSCASRQISRDTLPDDPDSSHFDEAMEGTQTLSQRDHDDDPQQPFGYSQLPVSERERSEHSASQEQPSSDGHRRRDATDDDDDDDDDHHPLIATPGTAQPLGDNRGGQVHIQSSETLNKSTGTEGQGDANEQAAAVTYSEDSMLLQPSSVCA
jgi:hypothetical protein